MTPGAGSLTLAVRMGVHVRSLGLIAALVETDATMRSSALTWEAGEGSRPDDRWTEAALV
jgi:hypothetical protein